MGRKSKYTEEFKNTIIELYKSGKTIAELNVEYGIPTCKRAVYLTY